jgi:hypothetical protein
MAAVHDHIQQRAYWQDNTAQATVEQAQQQTFTAYEGVLGLGYTQSTTWVRLQIVPTAQSAADDKLVLRIRPVFLDRITLFDPLDTSGKRRITGDQTEYNNQEYKSLTHTFVIPMGQQHAIFGSGSKPPALRSCMGNRSRTSLCLSMWTN